MAPRTRVLAVPVVLVVAAVALAAALTPCVSRLSANPGQAGPEAGAPKGPAPRACPAVRRT